MKAYVLHNINDIQVEEINKPIPKDNEVIVKIMAAGICGSDIPRIYTTGTYSYPLIPGHEFSGIVTEVGAEVNAHWLDKRVGIFPLIPCGKCTPCMNRSYELCRNYSYLGSRCNGGFAEYVAVPVNNLIELPDNVSFEEAAMLEPMSVAAHAIRRTGVNENDTALVCGLGTIGIFVIMLLRELGVKKILAIGNKNFQKETLTHMGFDENDFCDIRYENIDTWILDKTDQNGVNVYFECVGKNENVIAAVNNTAPNGRIMLVGNPYSDMTLAKNVYWKILRNQITLLGTWNSSFTHEENDDWHYILNRLEENKIKPSDCITHKFNFDGLMQGFEIMRDKSEEYIKIMYINDNP